MRKNKKEIEKRLIDFKGFLSRRQRPDQNLPAFFVFNGHECYA